MRERGRHSRSDSLFRSCLLKIRSTAFTSCPHFHPRKNKSYPQTIPRPQAIGWKKLYFLDSLADWPCDCIGGVRDSVLKHRR